MSYWRVDALLLKPVLCHKFNQLKSLVHFLGHQTLWISTLHLFDFWWNLLCTLVDPHQSCTTKTTTSITTHHHQRPQLSATRWPWPRLLCGHSLPRWNTFLQGEQLHNNYQIKSPTADRCFIVFPLVSVWHTSLVLLGDPVAIRRSQWTCFLVHIFPRKLASFS